MRTLDVRGAFLYGRINRRVYIELPSQDPRAAEGDLVGVLQRSMYGTRDAPMIWQGEVRRCLEHAGLKESTVQSSLYYHLDKQLIVVVHVDDFLISGPEEHAEWLYNEIRKSFEVTQTILKEGEEVKYLNRRIRNKGAEGFTIEGDPKHADILIKEWKMTKSSQVATPMTRETRERLSRGSPIQDPEESSRIRRSIARISYMSQDRADLACIARILAQQMSQPNDRCKEAIKRVIRYLRKVPRVISQIKGEGPDGISAWTDADWAGDILTRKSCSGGCLFVNGDLISHWSKTQQNVAISSGESELNATVKAISETIGISEILSEATGKKQKISLKTDSRACRGILMRHGCGKVKHLTTKQLWVQGAIKTYEIEVIKIKREENMSDLMTHENNPSELTKFMKRMGYIYEECAQLE